MYLTDDEVLQFQAIYRQQFGKDISKEDALEQGIKLVRLFEIVYNSNRATNRFDKIDITS